MSATLRSRDGVRLEPGMLVYCLDQGQVRQASIQGIYPEADQLTPSHRVLVAGALHDPYFLFCSAVKAFEAALAWCEMSAAHARHALDRFSDLHQQASQGLHTALAQEQTEREGGN